MLLDRRRVAAHDGAGERTRGRLIVQVGECPPQQRADDRARLLDARLAQQLLRQRRQRDREVARHTQRRVVNGFAIGINDDRHHPQPLGQPAS